MEVAVTYFTEVTSSWCYWVEPVWAELKRRYADRVTFSWKIALLGPDALPVSREQLEWFYRRSGTLTRSPFKLNSAWYDQGRAEYLAPNCVAEAARELGIADDRVRLALAEAALREGKKVGEWDISVETAARAGNLDPAQLLAAAKDAKTERRIRETTAEFYSHQINQRPAFIMESVIGDKAVFSGFASLGPLSAAITAMLADCSGYSSYATHFGSPPSS